MKADEALEIIHRRKEGREPISILTLINLLVEAMVDINSRLEKLERKTEHSL